MTEVAIALHDETQTQAQGLNRVDCRRQHRLRHRRRFGSNTGKLYTEQGRRQALAQIGLLGTPTSQAPSQGEAPGAEIKLRCNGVTIMPKQVDNPAKP